MAEDWRVTVVLHEEGLVSKLLPWLHEHEVEEGVRERLGGRVAVSAGNDRVFLYADTQEAAEEAARVAQDVLAERELEADLGLARWHPIAERWEEPSLPLPRTDAEREAEVDEREEDETAQSQATGEAQWEVRVELPSHGDAQDLADRLEGEGLPVVRRWTFLLVGANDAEEADELARRLESQVPPGSTVHVEPGGGFAWQVPEGNPFALFGGLGL